MITIKRLFDLSFVISSLLAFFPVFVFVAILVRLNLGAPILFSQKRPGLKGSIFEMIKFRSMTSARDDDGKLLPDEYRLTSFGKFLRSTSLDELPSLWNVLRGNMSIIGPRPLLVEYLPLYSKEQARRHEVSPGITGWAQVNGRNAISWEQKFRLDVWYVDNQSVFLDIKILWMTVKRVLIRDGVSADGEVTMPKFTGEQR